MFYTDGSVSVGTAAVEMGQGVNMRNSAGGFPDFVATTFKN
jgi:xanthine dehydrogenase molybdopterin-binding subunit B